MDQQLRNTGDVALSTIAILPGLALAPLPTPSLTTIDILFVAGLLALFFELVHPGAHLPGIAGAVALILGGVLLVQSGFWLPALAMLGGFVWLLVIARRGTRWWSALPGLLAFALGVLLLSAHGVSLLVSLLLLAIAAGGVLMILTLVRSIGTLRPRTGSEALVGSTGVALQPIDPTGQVRLRGERWSAKSLSGPLEEGAAVRVVGLDGLTLLVELDAPGPQEDLRSVSERTNQLAARHGHARVRS